MRSSSSDPEVLPAVHALCTTFKRLLGDQVAHAARDHCAATSMAPQRLVNGRLEPVPPRLKGTINHSEELSRWAGDRADGTRKLLIVQPHAAVGEARPRGWVTAELINQRLSGKSHGRKTVVLMGWCRGRDVSGLMASLIMQLIASSAFGCCKALRLRNGPPSNVSNRTQAMPVPYDLQKLSRRESEYLVATFRWLLGLLKDSVTVYCVLDTFDSLEDRIGVEQRDALLAELFDLVQSSRCNDGGLDFRLLLMGPRFVGRSAEFMQRESLRETIAEYGLILMCGEDEETSTPSPEREEAEMDSGSVSTEASFHTAWE